jgi:hypothetical protein
MPYLQPSSSLQVSWKYHDNDIDNNGFIVLSKNRHENNTKLQIIYINKVVTKPQVRSNCDVTSFRRKQILQNFIVETDGRTEHPSEHPSELPTDGVSYRGATSHLKSHSYADQKPLQYLAS